MTLTDKIKAVIKDVPDFPHKGILFKDISPVFLNQTLCNEIVETFVQSLTVKPDAIVGIESRGFLLGILLANKLNVPFVLVRKAGKLPAKTISKEYALEYGTAKIEIHEGVLQPGWKVLIHDDILATGGTAAAAAELVNETGAQLMGFTFMASIDVLNGRSKIETYTKNIQCLVHY